MSKNFFHWSLFGILLTGMLSVGIVSCGDDDDEEKDDQSGVTDGQDGAGEVKSAMLEGVWQYQYNDDDDIIKMVLNFFGDGKGIFAEIEIEGDDGETDADGNAFTYVMSGDNAGIITILDDDYGTMKQVAVLNFKLEDGKLIVTGNFDNSSYYSYNYGSSNNSYILTKIAELGNNADVVGHWSVDHGSETYSLDFAADGKGMEQEIYDDPAKSSRNSSKEFKYTANNDVEGIIQLESSYYGLQKYKYRIVGNAMYLLEDEPYVDVDAILYKQQ